jgi:CCR4-NOT transcription complex subunit 1
MHLSPEIKDSKDPVVFFFNDWIRLSQFPSTTDKLCATFVGQLIQQGMLKSRDSLKMFFKICLELSIDMYIKYKRIPSIICYQSVDAIAKLLYSLFRNYSGNDQHSALSDLWTCFLEVVGELVSEFISKQNYFLQKPVARLLFSALEELSALEKEDSVMHTHIILSFK